MMQGLDILRYAGYTVEFIEKCEATGYPFVCYDNMTLARCDERDFANWNAFISEFSAIDALCINIEDNQIKCYC